MLSIFFPRQEFPTLTFYLLRSLSRAMVPATCFSAGRLLSALWRVVTVSSWPLRVLELRGEGVEPVPLPV